MIVVLLNLMVVGVALIGILFLALRTFPESEHSKEEIQRRASSVSDADTLRKLVLRDDAYIRSLEHIISTFRVASRAFLILLGTLGALAAIVALLPQPKN